MAKPKNLEQLRAEKEQVETQLAQEQHKLERLENRKKYLEKGERQKRTHNRKKFCARIATGDYDAVIIGHHQHGGVSPQDGD